MHTRARTRIHIWKKNEQAHRIDLLSFQKITTINSHAKWERENEKSTISPNYLLLFFLLRNRHQLWSWSNELAPYCDFILNVKEKKNGKSSVAIKLSECWPAKCLSHKAAEYNIGDRNRSIVELSQKSNVVKCKWQWQGLFIFFVRLFVCFSSSSISHSSYRNITKMKEFLLVR